MATISTSLTPSEENHRNKIDDSMYAALDKVMANTEQSYDEFVNAFTYLKEGLTKPVEQTKRVSPVCTSKGKNTRDVKTEGLLAHTLPANTEQQTKSIREPGKKQNSCMDDIEEEFDNFVEPDEDNFGEPDDDIEQDMDHCETHAGYLASFSQCERSIGKRQVNSVAQMTKCQAADDIRHHPSADPADISDVLTSQMTLDKNSTDKLLLNFLADLQNEMNDKISLIQTPVEDVKAMSIVAQKIDTETTSVNMWNDKVKSELDAEVDHIKFDDDDCNSALTSCDHSCSKDVKVIINQTELKRMADAEQRHDVNGTAKSNEIHSAVLIDSEGLLKMNEIASDDNSQAELPIRNDNVLFPGQIEECCDVPGSEHKRYLEFKAKYVERSVNDANTEDYDSNTIKPFQLDDDFDYDNVILTPKWSSQELYLLTSQRRN